MQTTEIIIQPIPIEEVLAKDKAAFNSNNHWIHDEPPLDYRESIEKNHTRNWIHLFRTSGSYHTFTIEVPFWMKEAAHIGKQTGQFSHLFDEELNDYLNSAEPKVAHYFDKNIGYFVRTENVSLKYGQHGVGPYYSLKQIIESAVSCIRGHCPIYEDTETITIYLLPWVSIFPFNEYRVFVHHKKITAISQQHLHSVFPENPHVPQLISKIKNYFENHIRDKLANIDSFVYDFAFDGDGKEFFIETNTFGKEYAAGSALFHWILDEDILYGNSHAIHYRFTTK
jgi:hypothetical protein